MQLATLEILLPRFGVGMTSIARSVGFSFLDSKTVFDSLTGNAIFERIHPPRGVPVSVPDAQRCHIIKTPPPPIEFRIENQVDGGERRSQHSRIPQRA